MKLILTSLKKFYKVMTDMYASKMDKHNWYETVTVIHIDTISGDRITRTFEILSQSGSHRFSQAEDYSWMAQLSENDLIEQGFHLEAPNVSYGLNRTARDETWVGGSFPVKNPDRFSLNLKNLREIL